MSTITKQPRIIQYSVVALKQQTVVIGPLITNTTSIEVFGKPLYTSRSLAEAEAFALAYGKVGGTYVILTIASITQ